MAPDLFERGEVDPRQHEDDHTPDQQDHRQVDRGALGRADRPEVARYDGFERDADHDAEPDPQCWVAFEQAYAKRLMRWRSGDRGRAQAG